MKRVLTYAALVLLVFFLLRVVIIKNHAMKNQIKIVFLHHSTGQAIWKGNASKYLTRLGFSGNLEKWFDNYNKLNGTHYLIEQQDFPKRKPYGWKNYPYDYYNIWVKNAGDKGYMEEPTLEMLSADYDVIIWKHCFPVGRIQPDSIGDIDSEVKTLQNYKLQYLALKEKMHQFPNTKFIVWTGAALVESATTPEQAARAREFVNWVKRDWDEPGDNIFLWDFYELEVQGGLYLKPDYRCSPTDSHPNMEFSASAAKLFSKRIVDVVEGRGDSASLTAE
jgi:hypothetical protein